MTRINCVPPEELCRQHLLAEYRELPRVFRLAERAVGRPTAIPPAYTLGKGHVTFFYNKLGYCRERWRALRAEMLARGYAPAYDAPPRVRVPAEWQQDWTPDPVALQINRERIAARMPS
jgi:hypothetical protein